MVWDKTLPAGSEDASNGDNRLRELKTDLEGALQAQDVDEESVFPGSDTTFPVYRYRGLKGPTSGRPAAGDYGLFFDSTRNVMQRDNGTSWEDVGTLIPAATVMVFYQAAAPVGWTKIVTQDDKALRVVSGGTGGTAGGTQSLSTAITLAHSHTVAAHTHTIAHRHTAPVGHSGATTYHADASNFGQGTETIGGSLAYQAASAGFGPQSLAFTKTKDSDTTNSGSSASTTDSQLSNWSLAYVDVILASKD